MVTFMEKDYSKIAILILNFNGKKLLKNCIRSLMKIVSKEVDIYVIDNGSRDGSIQYVLEHFPSVTIFSLGCNLGFSRAYNLAVRTLNYPYIVLLNNDTVVSDEWLGNLFRAIQEDPLTAAAGSKILLLDNKNILNHAGAKITSIGGGYDIGLFDKDQKKYDKRYPVGAVCGASMMIKRDIFVKIGGFDEAFFSYFEDTDYCWRCLMYGYSILYVPRSVIYHEFGGTWGQNISMSRVFHSEKNRLSTIIKNFETSTLIKALAISTLFTIVRFFKYLYEKNLPHIVSILNAQFWTIKNLKGLISQRIFIQSNRKIDDDTLQQNGCIASLGESILEFRRMKRLH